MTTPRTATPHTANPDIGTPDIGTPDIGTPDIARRITANCLMGRTRYLSRVLSGIYDEEVRSFGIQSSQVTPLAVIAINGPVRRADIGKWLHLDSSTLTRNLRVMLDNGWVTEEPDAQDARSRRLRITPAGAGLLDALAPAWERAQRRAIDLLGEDGRGAVVRLFNDVQAANP